MGSLIGRLFVICGIFATGAAFSGSNNQIGLNTGNTGKAKGISLTAVLMSLTIVLGIFYLIYRAVKKTKNKK